MFCRYLVLGKLMLGEKLDDPHSGLLIQSHKCEPYGGTALKGKS